MKVWCVVQIGYYDENDLVSVHAREENAVVKAAHLMLEQKKNDRPAWPKPGPYRVIEKEIEP